MQEGNLPLFLVLNAYRRAWTIAFGSICLGSMFVAIVQGLYAVVSQFILISFNAMKLGIQDQDCNFPVH